MDIGGPLRGTWMTVLVISIAFVAAGVASAEPWSTPARMALAAQSADQGITTSTGVSDPSGTPPSPASSSSTISALAPTDAGDVPEVPDAVAADEIVLWERAQNHGFFVSRQAHDVTGVGKGCAVTGVARSDIGKPEPANGAPTSSTGACEDGTGKAQNENAAKDDEAKNENAAKDDEAKNENAAKDGKAKDEGTDE